MTLRKIRTNSLILLGLTSFVIGIFYVSTLRKYTKDEFAAQAKQSPVDPTFNRDLTRKTMDPSQISSSFSFAYNTTHLWSMQLADEVYYRAARQIPCRIVEYVTFNITKDKMNHCEPATNDEFSVESTVEAQQWLYEHQHPSDCSNKKIAVLYQFAWSGFGSTLHQVLWAFGVALSQGRIAVYQTPGNWLYGNCPFGTPDCYFLPLSNCSVPTTIDGERVRMIKADTDHWYNAILPEKFRDRSMNWVRAQLMFYLMRFNPETLAHVRQAVAQFFQPPTVEANRPYAAVYVRRSDKVFHKEMAQAYTLDAYLNLFDADARRANISTIYLNSEDEKVFDEFKTLPKEKLTYYRLLTIKARRDVVFMSMVGMQPDERRKVVLEFLTDFYIETHADLHAGTLTSNYCRLVDEIRLALGKFSPFYTPEDRFIVDM